MRISNFVQQQKKNITKHTYLKIIKGKFLPCSLTTSTEDITNHDLYKYNLKSIVTRFILHDNNKQRISIDFQNHEYFLNGETENPQECDNFYELFLQYLNDLEKFVKFEHYDNFEIQNYNSIPSRKLEIFKIGDPVEYLAIKFKYDGHKGKFVTDNRGRCYYFDAIENISEIQLPEELTKYRNIIFQIELTQNHDGSGGNFILTDIIGTYINKQLFSTTPMDVLNFFETMDIPQNFQIDIDGRYYTLGKQQRIEKTAGTPIYRYDGYILVTDRSEYKLKFPTIDLQLENKFFYIYDADAKPQQVNDYQYPYPDGTYEVMRERSDLKGVHKLIILRKRYDRHYPSTAAEYETFNKANELWMKYFNEHANEIIK
jgi:hypothetical protein